MENLIIKDVGNQPRIISKNEFIMRYGYQLSIALMSQDFIESSTLLNYEGNIVTTITKEKNE